MARAQKKIDVEHWVVRMMRKDGRDVRLSDMTLLTRLATLALVDKGDLILMPDGRIGKPVEGYTAQEDAHARRELLRLQLPGVEFRVIIATDAPKE